MPPASRVTDMHTCPMVTPGTPPIPHVGGPILPACQPNVLIGGLPAARVGDLCICVGPVDTIVRGASTVLVGGRPAARIGDSTAHGGVIVAGLVTVLIGESGAGAGGGGGAGAAPPSAAAAGSGPVAAPQAPTALPALVPVLPANGLDPLAQCVIPKDPLDDTEFGNYFKSATGDATIGEVIARYKADTGEDVTGETIQILFTDSKKARELLMADKNLHTRLRPLMNNNLPATAEEAVNAGWKRPAFLGSKNLGAAFHNPFQNLKYVSPDGHREVVINRWTGEVDTSIDYLGTFNFFPPSDGQGHKAADVDPFRHWGTN